MGNYKVDVVKLSPFIRKALKKGVEKKTLVQVKASYKLGKVEKPKKPKKPKKKKPKKPAAKKAKSPKKAAKPKAKKPAAKKPAAKKTSKEGSKEASQEGCTKEEVNSSQLFTKNVLTFCELPYPIGSFQGHNIFIERLYFYMLNNIKIPVSQKLRLLVFIILFIVLQIVE